MDASVANYATAALILAAICLAAKALEWYGPYIADFIRCKLSKKC